MKYFESFKAVVIIVCIISLWLFVLFNSTKEKRLKNKRGKKMI